MRTLHALLLGITLLAVAPGHALSQTTDPNLGRNLASNCANCHGTNGRAQPPMLSLAGQQKDVLIRAMQEFKDGKRPATIMHQLSKGYTDEQIEAIASYLAAQKTR